MLPEILFAVVFKDFLGKAIAANYTELVPVMLTNFHALGARMSIKIHYLFSHLGKFSKIFGDVSEEHGDRFPRDIKLIERYPGRWDSHMMVDYC